jgi:DNA polymerase-1
VRADGRRDRVAFLTWDVSRFQSLDLETYLIEGGLLTPRIVCGSTCGPEALDRSKTASRWFMDRFVGIGAVHRGPGSAGELIHPKSAVLTYARTLLDSDRIIVGANVAYDLACLAAEDPDLLSLIFKAYGEGRVYDVQIAQALHAIAEGNLYADPVTGMPMHGRYSLETCVRFVLGREDAKDNDYWRMRYALLENVPVSEWPAEARQYPVDDAVNTLEVAVAQVNGDGGGVTPGPHRNLGDLSNQVETAFALHLGAVWGLRTDPDRVEALRKRTEAAHTSFVERFRALGFFKADGKQDGRAVRIAVIKAYGGSGPCPAKCAGGKVLSERTGNPVKCPECSGTGMDISAAPKTPAGGVSADRDTLMESGDPDLVALGENEAEKTRDTYLPWLETGIAKPITLRPNVLVGSGRTSYDGLIQLVPTKGGVRECFRARDGYVYCSVDFGAGELCTFAQICLKIFGHSQMAETINATGDPGGLHTAFAARLAGRTTEEMKALVDAADELAKAIRQLAKFCNFALLGGMGAPKFCLLARKKSAGKTTAPDGTVYHGLRFCILLGGAERCGERRVTEFKGYPTPPICAHCLEVAADLLRPMWLKQWPEVPVYFRWVQSRVEAGGEFPCFGTERVRGGLEFTSGANNGFQALLADAAKHALRRVARECYVGDGVLAGTRPIFFAHDEIVAEMPEATAHLAGPRMAKLMVEASREYIPDVCMVAEPALMRFWDKGVQTVHDESGRLVVWEPKREAA